MEISKLARHIRRHVATALAEDVASGDVTAALLDRDTRVTASIVCREKAILCGRAWADEVFQQLDKNIKVDWHHKDADEIKPGDILCRIEGLARPIMTGERTALNYLQCLSGTATLARRYALAVAGTDCRVLDTRKTIPGLRLAQKYAVTCGGCHNHRNGLYDGILIKENHIIAAGSISGAVTTAKQLGSELPIEVEVENLDELAQALDAQADIVMLDNFSLKDTRAAVALNQGRAKLEASGNMQLDRLQDVAATGVDFVSVGALTKNVMAIDLSMRVEFSG